MCIKDALGYTYCASFCFLKKRKPTERAQARRVLNRFDELPFDGRQDLLEVELYIRHAIELLFTDHDLRVDDTIVPILETGNESSNSLEKSHHGAVFRFDPRSVNHFVVHVYVNDARVEKTRRSWHISELSHLNYRCCSTSLDLGRVYIKMAVRVDTEAHGLLGGMQRYSLCRVGYIIAYIYKNSNMSYTGTDEENTSCDTFSRNV